MYAKVLHITILFFISLKSVYMNKFNIQYRIQIYANVIDTTTIIIVYCNLK